MIAFVLAFAVIVLLALAVVAVVAVQARREGREVLTAHGEHLVQTARRRVGSEGATTPADGGDHAAGGAEPQDSEPREGEPRDGEPQDGEPRDGDIDLRHRDDVTTA